MVRTSSVKGHADLARLMRSNGSWSSTQSKTLPTNHAPYNRSVIQAATITAILMPRFYTAHYSPVNTQMSVLLVFLVSIYGKTRNWNYGPFSCSGMVTIAMLYYVKRNGDADEDE